MKRLPIDSEYMLDTLFALLAIPSPSGYTDRIVHHVGEELERLGIPFELIAAAPSAPSWSASNAPPPAPS